MSISFIKEKVQVKDKRDALRLHLMIKSFQNDVNLSLPEINSLVELKEVGYNKQFYLNCISKGFYKSEQTVRNAVAKMTIAGILISDKRGERRINPEYLPEGNSEKVLFQYLVGNL